MGWKEETRFRFQYASDGISEMSWQPTSVYLSDKRINAMPAHSGGEDAERIFLFFSGVIAATFAYQYIGKISYVGHLSAIPHATATGVTTIAAFLGSIALLEMKIVQTFIKTIIFISACFLLLHR